MYQPVSAQPATHEIHWGLYRDGNMTVKQGDTVVWTTWQASEGSVHTVTSTDSRTVDGVTVVGTVISGGELDSGLIQYGDEYEHVFDGALGDYPYQCSQTIEGLGDMGPYMKGTITVIADDWDGVVRMGPFQIAIDANATPGTAGSYNPFPSNKWVAGKHEPYINFEPWKEASTSNNGEAVCENHGYAEDVCRAIGCCNYDVGEQECYSEVGRGQCDHDGGPSDGNVAAEDAVSENEDDYSQTNGQICACMSRKCQAAIDECHLDRHIAYTAMVVANYGGTEQEEYHVSQADTHYRDNMLCSINAPADDNGIFDRDVLELKITLKLMLHCEHAGVQLFMTRMDAYRPETNFEGLQCDSEHAEDDAVIVTQLLNAIEGGLPHAEQSQILAILKREGGFTAFAVAAVDGRLDLDIDMRTIMADVFSSSSGADILLKMNAAGIESSAIAAATGISEANLNDLATNGAGFPDDGTSIADGSNVQAAVASIDTVAAGAAATRSSAKTTQTAAISVVALAAVIVFAVAVKHKSSQIINLTWDDEIEAAV